MADVYTGPSFERTTPMYGQAGPSNAWVRYYPGRPLSSVEEELELEDGKVVQAKSSFWSDDEYDGEDDEDDESEDGESEEEGEEWESAQGSSAFSTPRLESSSNLTSPTDTEEDERKTASNSPENNALQLLVLPTSERTTTMTTLGPEWDSFGINDHTSEQDEKPRDGFPRKC